MREIERLEQAGKALFYLDECGIDHRLYREYGRAPRGQRIYQEVHGAFRKRTSIISTSRDGKMIAPMVFEGACNTNMVDAYFKKVLLPQLPRGSVLVLDNASFHHSPTTAKLAKKAGVELLFLPAYSPDLNPIEHLWSHFKTKLKKGLHCALDPFRYIADMSLCYC